MPLLLGEGFGDDLEPLFKMLPKPGMKARPLGPPMELLALGAGLGGVRLLLELGEGSLPTLPQVDGELEAGDG